VFYIFLASFFRLFRPCATAKALATRGRAKAALSRPLREAGDGTCQPRQLV